MVLFSYINKPYSLVHSRSRDWVHWKTQNKKIQAAIQCPSGSQYIFLTTTGHLYQLDLDLDLETVVPTTIGRMWAFKHQPQSPDEFVALAMPELEKTHLIYAFRIENKEMILEEIRGNSMPQKKTFPAPPFPDL